MATRERFFGGIFLGAAALCCGCALVIHYDDYKSGAGGAGGAEATSAASTSSGSTGKSSSSASSNASSSASSGRGGPCTVASSCPGIDGPCSTRTCKEDRCGVEAAPAGPWAKQVLGDCKQAACDGKGATVEQVDENDVPPDDGNECTNEACFGAAPIHPPKPVGTPCGPDLMCVNQHYLSKKGCAADVTCTGVAPFSSDCSPYMCGNGACATSCAIASECVSPYLCIAGSCCSTCALFLSGKTKLAHVCAGAAMTDAAALAQCACQAPCSADCPDLCLLNGTGVLSSPCSTCVTQHCTVDYGTCIGK